MVTETRDPRLLPALPLGDGAVSRHDRRRSGLEVGLELRARLADSIAAYDDALDEGELERWPEFFTEACVYKITAAREFRRGAAGRA